MKIIQFKIFVSFLVCVIPLIQSAPSAIIPKQLTSDAVQVSKYIVPSNYPGYYIYNYVQIDHGRGIPLAIFDHGNPGVIAVHPTYTYYGTPVYDYRYQFNPLYPGFSGHQPPFATPTGQPPFLPAQKPNFQPTTQKPSYEDDGIEKLDEKFDPTLEGNDDSHRDDNDDDSVTIDAI